MSQPVDVEANLTAMDGKLRELRHELSVLTTERQPMGPARPDVPAIHGADEDDLPLAAAAADQAHAIIAGAQAEATRIVEEAVQRVTGIAAQMDHLERLRDELERAARALVDEYAAGLSHPGQPSPATVAPTEGARRSSQSPASPVHPPLW
jgi:cell division septum initiation protein DivIVA